MRPRCRHILLAGAIPAAFLLSACAAVGITETPAADASLRIHERVLTLDSHIDIPVDFASDSVDPGERGRFRVDLPKMREGGLDAAFWIVYVGQTERTPEAYAAAQAAAMTKFDAIHRMTRLFPEQVELAHTAADVARIHADGRIAAAIGVENGFAIGRDLELLDRFHELGARYLTLAHGGHNDICDSATPRTGLGDNLVEHGGVSEFGAQVIARLNRLGIMVDVSHVSKQAALDAMRLSRAPVIASHSSTRALANHPRNLDDETLLALRDNGGVLQTVAFAGYVKVSLPEKGAAIGALHKSFDLGARPLDSLSTAQRAEYDTRLQRIRRTWPAANLGDFVDHIDYAVGLIGIDHVGISSDFDGGGGLEGWRDASETANVTAELLRRGYTEADIAKLWGGNLLRVWRAAEQVAARRQAQPE